MHAVGWVLAHLGYIQAGVLAIGIVGIIGCFVYRDRHE